MKSIIKKIIIWTQIPLTALAQLAGYYGYMIVADQDNLTVLFMQNKPLDDTPIFLSMAARTNVEKEIMH